MMEKEELQSLINLLFSGKFGFSAQENQRVITPLINKMSQVLESLNKKPEKKENKKEK